MAPAVPFNRPTRTPRDLELVAEAIEAGALAGDGPYTAEVEQRLAERLGVARVLLTPSGTAALELAVLVLGLGPGDEVIVPSFAFPSTAAAVALRGATPVFCEVDPTSLNVDVDHAASLVTPRTKAIVPVHYGGIAAGLDELVQMAADHRLLVLEDAAHSLFGTWRGRPLGAFGAAGAFSFHATKNITCGEGGALALQDPELIARAEVLREKGTDRARFLRGEVDRYTWVEVGSSFVLAEPLAALLSAQLRAADEVQAARKAVWCRYAEDLAPWAQTVGATLCSAPPEAEPAWHNFWLLVPDPGDRDPLLTHLAEAGVQGTFHFQPLHTSAVGRRLAPERPSLPVTDAVAARLVRLPFFTSISDADQDRVVATVQGFTPGRQR